MGMHQKPLKKTSTLYARTLKALLYPWNEKRPKAVSVTYQGDRRHPERGRYVYAGEELDHQKRQPYIHDLIVHGTYNRRQHQFRVFFKRHCRLPKNAAIRALRGATVSFNSDVLVVAMGPRNGIRNLRGVNERLAANACLRQLTRRLGDLRVRKYIPAEITL
ncbi:hypothetical protein EV715DRAFT_268667 [Schizophyllum commune]